MESIKNSTVITATDAAVNGNLLGGVWLITTTTKEYKTKHRLFLKDWKLNIPKIVEAITLLDLVETIVKRTE